MDKTLKNTLRNVLMNEMGLTKESIRREMADIVEKECQKALLNDSQISKIQRNILQVAEDAIRRQVTNAVKAEVQKTVKTLTEKTLAGLRIAVTFESTPSPAAQEKGV